MSTIVQRNYRPQIAPAVAGMISETSGWDAITRQVETAAGLGFGMAASQGVGDRGCILGGANFIGISIRDITQNAIPIDPMAADGTVIPVDVIPRYANVALLTRGHIWVFSHGGGTKGVVASDPLYYVSASGLFTNAAGGTAANGLIEFTGQPADGQTMTFAGTVWTFKASGAAGAQSNIGPTLGDTLAAAAAGLEASADVNLDTLTFWAWPPSPGGSGQGSGSYQIRYAAKAVGVGGNSIVVSTNVPGATVTPMAGGSAAGIAVVGGYWLDSVGAGELARVSLGIQR